MKKVMTAFTLGLGGLFETVVDEAIGRDDQPACKLCVARTELP